VKLISKNGVTLAPADMSVSAASAVPVMHQRTLKTAIGCTGIGLHSGAKIAMTLHPADADTGIRFRRTDLAACGAIIPAMWNQVGDTRMNSTLCNQDGVMVGTVEHLMSALAGSGIDNCLIDISGAEVPVMDGSAAPFLFLIECAGTVEQTAPRRAIKVLKHVEVRDGEKFASISPSTGFSIEFHIDFNSQAIAQQDFCLAFSRGSFKAEVSRARTFGFEQEVAFLRSKGLARGGSLDNAVVIDSTGTRVLNDDGLRYPDEFVRHKILDAVGDLYLAGAPLIGHVHAIRSGHALNNQLLRTLFADQTAWTYTTIAPGSAIAPAAPLAAVVNG